MARKPNYAFERTSRAKAKAAKREAKRQAKIAARASSRSGTSEPEPQVAESTAVVDGESRTGQAENGQEDGA
jgi:hypothetical protein